MARQKRIKLEADGTTYHLLNRTIFGLFLFDDYIREWLYTFIVDLAECYCIDLHNIAIMSNHYHIVLSVRKPELDDEQVKERFQKRKKLHPWGKAWNEDEVDIWRDRFTDLSAFMTTLDQQITRYVQKVHNIRGHVFQGRFKSVLIEDGPGLLACAAYVELNPVRAKIVERASEYRWCSAGRFRQGGLKAAGVIMPPLANFEFLKNDLQRRDVFVHYIDHLADLELGVESEFPVDQETIRALVTDISLAQCRELMFRRTKWATQSYMLGSQEFCRTLIRKLGLRKPNTNPQKTTSIMDLFHNSLARGSHTLE